ncbi:MULTISPECIES: DUF5618 family protein [Dyadobacter]|uniref:DUF5618 domain-containing protein n=1 Tax=Dyadobacter fermentans (strain ATCC 700827 / DSM 18053 / CIP 107007 / KCTC 52180 / NS114) TaxID=471854 RepID=C6VY69_DYAFD|nr:MULTISPECIES: DUF5618 family protein [Dyadobacter]ACT96970.1 hypothetical protein Dfer_5782 [Dyadobacter fermentans DSM 18053]SEJ71615.1 hypothetical protein SAMN05216327_1178 [Dyadobacter sp. SG02]
MKDNLKEARRYLNNAKEMLSQKAKKEGKFYQDKKYIRLAGHAAYSGVLIALDNVLGNKDSGRKSVDWYKSELAKLDKKALTAFNGAYETLHLAMSYDGNIVANVSKSGIELADSIITWAETRTAAA